MGGNQPRTLKRTLADNRFQRLKLEPLTEHGSGLNSASVRGVQAIQTYCHERLNRSWKL